MLYEAVTAAFSEASACRQPRTVFPVNTMSEPASPGQHHSDVGKRNVQLPGQPPLGEALMLQTVDDRQQLELGRRQPKTSKVRPHLPLHRPVPPHDRHQGVPRGTLRKVVKELGAGKFRGTGYGGSREA